MTWVLRLVGSKAGRLVVGASVVILILFLTIRYIQQAERDKIQNEIIKEEITIREKVDEGIRNTPRDHDDIIDRLRERQGTD